MRGANRPGRWWHGVLATLAAMATVLLAAPTAAAAPEAALTAEAAVADGGVVDVFATSAGSALQVDGQDGRFPTTPMRHDAGSTRFYARLPVTPGPTVTSVTVRDPGADPPRTVSVAVQSISIVRATYDGTRLTLAAAVTDPTMYPLAVEAGGPIGALPSAAPVDFPVTAPPRTITVSSGAARVTAPVSIVGAAPGAQTTAASGAPTAKVAATTLAAPRGIATTIDGSGSTNAATFRAVIKSGPQGAVLIGDATSTPSIVLPTWAAPTDRLPRVAAPATPTVVTFTASDGGASSTVDVTVNPVGDDLVVTTASTSGAGEVLVQGTSTIAGAGPAPPTQVVVYTRTTTVANPTGLEADWIKVGAAAVDATGAFSVRGQPAPNVASAQYLVQTSRGTQVVGALGG